MEHQLWVKNQLLYWFCGHLKGRQFLSDFVILTQKPWLGRSSVLTMVVWLNLHGDQLLSKHLYLYCRVKNRYLPFFALKGEELRESQLFTVLRTSEFSAQV